MSEDPNISRSGRVRKKSSKLTDYQNPEDLDGNRPVKRIFKSSREGRRLSNFCFIFRKLNIVLEWVRVNDKGVIIMCNVHITRLSSRRSSNHGSSSEGNHTLLAASSSESISRLLEVYSFPQLMPRVDIRTSTNHVTEALVNDPI